MKDEVYTRHIRFVRPQFVPLLHDIWHIFHLKGHLLCDSSPLFSSAGSLCISWLSACTSSPPMLRVTSRLLGLLQETKSTPKFCPNATVSFPKLSINATIRVFSCSLLAPEFRKSRVLYSTGTRPPPRWLITGTWKTEIEHSHARMHSIYTRIHPNTHIR